MDYTEGQTVNIHVDGFGELQTEYRGGHLIGLDGIDWGTPEELDAARGMTFILQD